jgi:hypothetical protein
LFNLKLLIMALEWKAVGGKQVGIIDGATNPAFILDGNVIEIRITGVEHLSGEKAGTEAELKAYCSELLTEHSIPLEGTQTNG